MTERDAESAEGVTEDCFQLSFFVEMGSLQKVAHLTISSFPGTKEPTQDSNFIRQITNKYFLCEQTEVLRGPIPYLNNIYNYFGC